VFYLLIEMININHSGKVDQQQLIYIITSNRILQCGVPLNVNQPELHIGPKAGLGLLLTVYKRSFASGVD
jgi:hypothetical protein